MSGLCLLASMLWPQPGYDLVGKMHFKYILLSPQVVYFVCSGSEANDLALRIVECAAPGKHPPHVLAITICPHPRLLPAG